MESLSPVARARISDGPRLDETRVGETVTPKAREVLHAAESEPETRALVALGRVLIALRFLTPQEIQLTLLRAEALTRTYGPPRKRRLNGKID
jgi:hypothetical protein